MIPPALLGRLRQEGAVVLTIKVIPKASVNEVIAAGDAIKVKVTAAPEKGKANVALCEILAEAFGVARRNVEVMRGATSTTKQVRITCS